jgi:hypothetical protein
MSVVLCIFGYYKMQQKMRDVQFTDSVQLQRATLLLKPEFPKSAVAIFTCVVPLINQAVAFNNFTSASL